MKWSALRKIVSTPLMAGALCTIGLAPLAGCDLNTAPPPLSTADVIESSPDDGAPLSTLVVRTAADLIPLHGVRSYRGNLIVSVTANIPITLPDLLEVTGSIRVLGTAEAEVASQYTFASLTRVGGDVTVTHVGGTGRVEMPSLTAIGGHLDLSSSALVFSAPLLAGINGDLRLREAKVIGLDLPSLSFIGGALRLQRVAFAALPPNALRFPALESVAGDVDIVAVAAHTFDAPALGLIGESLSVVDVSVDLRLGGLISVGRDLVVDSAELRALDLKNLRTVGGDLRFSSSRGTGIIDLDLFSLATVAGQLVLTGLGGTETLTLDALTDLGRSARITDNPNLASLSFATLAFTSSDLLISGGGLLAFSAPRLTRVGGNLTLTEHGHLELDLPRLAVVTGDLVIAGTHLMLVELPVFTTVGRALTLRDLTSEEDALAWPVLSAVGTHMTIAATTYLDAVSFPKLASVGSDPDGIPIGTLTIRDNADLAGLDLARLALVRGDVLVRDNPTLADDALRTLLSGIAVDGITTLCSNQGGEPCP